MAEARADQKAGIAASIFAIEAIRRAGAALEGTIEQSATPDEESGGFAGVAWLCDVGRLARDRQRYVVITEPLDPERIAHRPSRRVLVRADDVWPHRPRQHARRWPKTRPSRWLD